MFNYKQYRPIQIYIVTILVIIDFFLDFSIYLQSVEIHSANYVLGSEGG
jgi:hypothetical protein